MRQIVDFSTALFTMDNRLYLKIPETTVSWSTFPDVYDARFWLLLLITVVVLVTALYFGSILAKDAARIGLLTSVATVYLSLIGQNIPITGARRVSLRILLLSTCVCTAVVLWGFQAGIVSVLTVEVIDLPIKSLQVTLLSWRNESLIPSEADAMKVLEACIYNSVNIGLFLTSLVTTRIFKFSMFMLIFNYYYKILELLSIIMINFWQQDS